METCLLDFDKNNSETQELEKLVWNSPAFKWWSYNENENMILVERSLYLRVIRKPTKKGIKFFLLKDIIDDTLNDIFEDSLEFKTLKEAKEFFESEKDFVEFVNKNNVVLDENDRYWIKFDILYDKYVVFKERLI